MTARKTQPRRIGGAVHRVLAELGHGQETPAMRLVVAWAEVAGEELDEIAEPVDLRGEILEVAVSSPAWAQQLSMRRGEFLEGLRERLGAEAPADLRFRVR